MLVLSRKIGEKIQIGNDITVTITRIAGNRVTLGVDAPRRLRIIRSELKPIGEMEEPTLPAARQAMLTVEVLPQGVEMSSMRRAR